MCLIVLAYQPTQPLPFVLAANRDEFYARPTQAMHEWPATGIIAGKDLEQGGTWLGLSRNGKFTAVTNFRDGKKPAPNLRSRGHLTRDFLLGAQDAASYIKSLEHEAHQYGGFNLLVGDHSGLYYLSNQDGISKRLTPGLYGLSNAALDTPWPKLTLAKQKLAAALATNTHAALQQVLSSTQQAADEELPNTGISQTWERQLSSCFIQLPTYGTRAMTLIKQAASGHTEIEERSFGPEGLLQTQHFNLALPPLG